MLPPIAKECGGRGPWGENVRPLPRASHALLAPATAFPDGSMQDKLKAEPWGPPVLATVP